MAKYHRAINKMIEGVQNDQSAWFDSLPSRHSLFQCQQWKYQDNFWNMFKVNNKDTRMTSVTLFWGVIVNLEQISDSHLKFLLTTLNNSLLRFRYFTYVGRQQILDCFLYHLINTLRTVFWDCCFFFQL